MKYHLVAAALLLAALAARPSQAADASGRFTVKGAGAASCATFTTAVGENGADLISFAGWLEGYLSAINRYEPGVYDIGGWRETPIMLAALARFCASNPATGFHDAIARMATQMRSAAITERSETVLLQNDAGSVAVPREVIRRVQGRLVERGLYQGPVDGEWTDATAAALAAFQRQKQVEVTSLPDQFTLVHLLP